MATPRHKLLVVCRVVVLCVLALAGFRAAFFTVYRVAGTSMLDTLFDGDRILVADQPWLVHPVRPGDTVVFEVQDEVLVKRVVGAPGDRVALLAGHVVRNGHRVAEAIPPAYSTHDTMHEVELGLGEYFVLGDHRAVSVDSRDFGPIEETQILGKVVLRMSGAGISTVAALERRR